MNENYKNALINAYIIVAEYERRNDEFVVEQKKVIDEAKGGLIGYYKKSIPSEIMENTEEK